MKLLYSNEHYEKDQGIKDGESVLVWSGQLFENNLIIKKYERFDGLHYAGGTAWKNACRVSEPIELEAGQVPVEYSDVWLKVYATSESDKAKVADEALADFKTREAKGDFKK